MRIGTSLHRSAQMEGAALVDFAQALEGAGYDFTTCGDHVLGGHPDRLRPGEQLPNSYDQAWHEPFITLSFVAAATKRLGLMTSILILPQRQTALVAKQSAELDLLSGGRLTLGVGIGRNWMEYEALDENFKNRGRRVEEQCEVMRLLWTQDLVTFEGKYHHIDRMAICPRPIQQPIPIWMGSYRVLGEVPEIVFQRVGRVADGFLSQFPPNAETRALAERLRGYAKEAGRDPSAIGINGILRNGPDPEALVTQAQAWRELGATSLLVSPAGGPGAQSTPQEMITELTQAREALAKAGV
jgi:probable F420-dependent oxidoreductase